MCCVDSTDGGGRNSLCVVLIVLTVEVGTVCVLC